MPDARFLCLVGALGVLDAGCRGEDVPEVTLVIDATRDQKIVFRPKAAYAEYVEVADVRHELRLTLASYEATCDDYRPPGDKEHVVTVVILTPPKEPPASGEYGFGSLPTDDQPVTNATAIPKAHSKGKSHLFQPGGGVKLTAVGLEPHASIAGVLDFSYPGDADHPASRIQGRFSAWLCRRSPAPKR